MKTEPDDRRVTKWLGIYVVAVLIGTFMLNARIIPEGWYAGWTWWQRLLLAVVGGPFLVVAYVAVGALLEGGLHALAVAMRAQPLATVILLGAVATVAGILIA